MAHKQTIVYIDSDQRYRKKAASGFKDSAYRCIFSKKGEEGLERILSEKPDVVVVDYFLPDITGEDLYVRFLTDPAFEEMKDIPFIVLTTNGKVDKTRLYSLGFSACLGKPFSSARLMEFIEDVQLSHRLKREEAQYWQTIEKAKSFLEKVVESSVDLIVTTDNKGTITYCNQASEELLGFQFEELVGERVSDFLEGNTSEMLKIVSFLRRMHHIQNYQTAVIDRQGRHILLNLTVSSLKNNAGKVIGALVTGRQLKVNDNREYISKASERMAAVVETAVAVNHEINNPLVPILGNAQFLLQSDTVADEELRRRLRSIVQNALRIRDITQKLAKIRHPVTKEYLRGTRMLDIEASI